MRVFKNFQGLNFLDLENPQSSRQGRRLCFQGIFFNFKEKQIIQHQGFFKDFQGTLEILENTKLDLKNNLKAFIVSNIMFINVSR